MINFILIYFISYFLTFLGFLLAKEEVVKDELKEIQRAITFSVDGLVFITYILMLYLFTEHIIVIIISITLLILKLISSHKKINYLKQIHNVLLFSSTILFTFKFSDSNLIYLSIIPMIVLFIENTNQKLSKRSEIYKFVLLTVLLILLNVL